MRKRPADFRAWLAGAEQSARELEEVLRPADGNKLDPKGAEHAYQRSRMLCSQCHGKYRDIPQSK
jgi:hypothetical protein